MHWHILGAGSIGGLWASCLALAGYRVTLLLKSDERVERFVRRPLCLESNGKLEYPAVELRTVHEPGGAIDFLLLSTKSYSTLSALASIEASLSTDARILLLQNGMGVQQRVGERFAGRQILAGVTTDGAYRREANHVVHAGRGETLVGPVSRVEPQTVDALNACFARIRLSCRWEDDIWRPIWRKLAINCCINAPSALHDCRNGELIKRRECRQLIRRLADEVYRVMSASNADYGIPDLFEQVVDVIEATADNYSSMHQDFHNGRQTEIEQINGFICSRGKALGMDTPTNASMVDAILRGIGPRERSR